MRSMTRVGPALLLTLLMYACSEGKRRSAGTEAVAELPPTMILSQVPLGDIAGPKEDILRGEIHNPYDGDKSAITEGETDFHRMNCVSCHGYGARGGMGPNLRDQDWRYGGTPIEIYKSIYEGRPKGMPAWGAMLPPETIWKLTAYIQSLGGAASPRDVLTDVEGWAAQSQKGQRSDDR
ncbi:MAG TPA: c-type cytochrome [Gemmatimonadaceae bacterium]|jgi:cytochrome c oxidase cbb3-type subunit 3